VATAVASQAQTAGWPAVMLATGRTDADLSEVVRRLLSRGSDEYPRSPSSALVSKSREENEMHDTTELPELDERALSRPEMSAADRSRWMALVVLCTGMLMIVLDTMCHS
jgi:hypothetical protein